jgi:NAD(P)-dependent dehydrogenase (short-subunit alcohol dehydrogenase family)
MPGIAAEPGTVRFVRIARRLALAGHEVIVSFARDQARLAALAARAGATAAEPSAAASAGVVVLAVPGDVIDEALRAESPRGEVRNFGDRPAAAASVLHGTGTARHGTGRPSCYRAGLAAPPP